MLSKGLTGDEGGGLVGGSDLGVQLDVHVVLLGELLVPLLASNVDPVLEGLANERVDHVADVAPGHLAAFSYAREGFVDDLKAEAEVEDLV